MGKAIPYDYRVKMIERIKNGEEIESIAEDLGYSSSGIRKIWRSYKKEGEESLKTKYKNCGRPSSYTDLTVKLVEEVRDNSQGGSYVRSKLEQIYPDMKAPSERTLQRWWVKQGTNRQRGRPTIHEKKMESKSS